MIDAGVVVTPRARRHVDQRGHRLRDVRDGNHTRRTGIRAAGGRLREGRERVAAAGTTPLRNVRLLRTIIDGVDDPEIGRRQEDEADIGRKFKRNVIGALIGVTISDKTGEPIPGDEA